MTDTIVGRRETLGHVYAELKVIDKAGHVSARKSNKVPQAEVVVFHFARLAGLNDRALAREVRSLLDTQPSARQVYDQVLEKLGIHDDRILTLEGVPAPTADQRAMGHIVYQYALLHALRLHRPALFAQSDYYFEASDPVGWLVALAVSGAMTLSDIVELRTVYLRAGAGSDGTAAALDKMSSLLKRAAIPIISPEGAPLQAKTDLQAATCAVFGSDARDVPIRQIHLNGNCQVLSLGSAWDRAHVDAGPFWTDVIPVLSPDEIWKRGHNRALDALEDHSTLALTDENEKVLRHAKGRRLLSSMVYAYVNIDEHIAGFGKGGSESMTIFLRKSGQDEITVRKILSEALTTADWNPRGEGVMLPPFAKAKKQAEYLQALPVSVRSYFPEVFGLMERDIPIPSHLQKDGKTTYKEVIYEMSYVPGDEVSRFVEKHSPSPAVIACLYEQIFRVLSGNLHTIRRAPAPGNTLDISYFKKIEDRLDLCRRTAPHTFGSELLDTQRIIINGVSYFNASALVKRFRNRPEFLKILEPRFHSLVMGDTNTENIKIANPAPLLQAQRLIDGGAPPEQIDAALKAVRAEVLGIRFLDPRAIGFESDGMDTRDDPMYDNKPWHNSIGHYDELHYEQFMLQLQTDGEAPRVDIEFIRGNPYQRAYRVRDAEVKGAESGSDPLGKGMEDYFRSVMTAAYGLDEPGGRVVMDDPYWLIRFVFVMGTHFTAMPPFHLQAELDGTLVDTYQSQRRAVAIYCEGIKWLNWSLEMLEGERREFLGVPVPPLPYLGDASSDYAVVPSSSDRKA